MLLTTADLPTLSLRPVDKQLAAYRRSNAYVVGDRKTPTHPNAPSRRLFGGASHFPLTTDYFNHMKKINDFLKDQVDNHKTPSVQYAFFDTNETIFASRYGVKNVSSGEAVDSATTYHLYSVTKTFTALAVLQLVQAGKVRLSDRIIQYIADFPYDSAITVEQLLSHTSGIPNPMPLKWIHLASEHRDFNHDAFFRDIFSKHAKLAFQPGAKFRYSNLGYVFLGQLIEKVSGKPYEEYIAEHIFAKIGIENGELAFEIDPARHATGYHKWWTPGNAVLALLIDKGKYMGRREGRWQPFNLLYNNGKAYGGIVGSANGLIRYAQALLRSDATLLDATQKHILFTEKAIGGQSTGMSFSWFTGTLKGNRYLAHAGGGGGYYVELRIYPDLGVGSAILYNRSGMRDERVLDKVDGFL